MSKVKEMVAEPKTETVSHNLCNEMTDAQREAIVYHSKLLNKYYESYEDMLKEEAEFKRQNEEKQKLSEQKKARAEEIKSLKQKTFDARREAQKLISDADNAYYKARAEFIKDYGSYHESYYNDGKSEVITINDMIDSLFKPWF